MPSGSYAREPRGSYRQRYGPRPVQFDVRTDARVALLIDREARKRGLMGAELLERIVERVFEDGLVKAVLDDEG